MLHCAYEKSTLFSVIAFIIVISAGAIVLATKQSNESLPVSSNQRSQTQSNSQSSESTDSQSEAPTADTFTAADVAKHSTESDCWTSINGSVYNLTSYISKHPGGDEILRACGVDGTQLFATQGGEGSHSSSAKNQLASLKIGTLSE